MTAAPTAGVRGGPVGAVVRERNRPRRARRGHGTGFARLATPLLIGRFRCADPSRLSRALARARTRLRPSDYRTLHDPFPQIPRRPRRFATFLPAWRKQRIPTLESA